MGHRRYFGFLVRQRINEATVPFFVFCARAKDIREWAGIRRTHEVEGGTQRLLRESRARQIARYLAADPNNSIPNNVLIAFDPGTAQFVPVDVMGCADTDDFSDIEMAYEQVQWGVIEFSYADNMAEEDRPALIVDGQHRLYGMYHFEQEDLPVVVISLLNAPADEQAFQFIVINSKQVKVPPDNAKAIIADLPEEVEKKLASRLLDAGVKYGDVSPILRDINDLPQSPFQHLLKWPYNRDGVQLVPLTAIEQSLNYMGKVFPFLEADEDTMLELFMSMWRGVQKHFEELWGIDTRLMAKVSLSALNEFLCDRLKMAWEFVFLNLFEPDDIETQSFKIVERIPQEFWTCQWKIKIQDNANVRALIKGDLEKISDNFKLRRNWDTDLELPVPFLSSEATVDDV